MVKFLASDLPVFLNLDMEVIQALMSFSVLLLFVGFVVAYWVCSSSGTFTRRIIFLDVIGLDLPFLFWRSGSSFALGP
jgi:hypothetical protein